MGGICNFMDRCDHPAIFMVGRTPSCGRHLAQNVSWLLETVPAVAVVLVKNRS